jgi:hypothetical protein
MKSPKRSDTNVADVENIEGSTYSYSGLPFLS